MKILENGVIKELTLEEYEEKFGKLVEPTYKEKIINAIRQKYSVDDELAILRQRDSKPEEFTEYFEFVENIKKELKEE